MTENIETSPKAPKFKADDRVKFPKSKNNFSKGCAEIYLREIFIIDSALKSNLSTYKIKDLNREKNNRKFYEN